MGPTLQPGERHLPSADELQPMAKRVAQLKSDGSPQPDGPDPLPFIAGFGLLAAIRPRRGEWGTTTEYGNVELTIPLSQRNSFQTVLNPTLVEGELDYRQARPPTAAIDLAAGPGALRAQDAVEERHHACGVRAGGLHRQTGGAGAAAARAPDPIPRHLCPERVPACATHARASRPRSRWQTATRRDTDTVPQGSARPVVGRRREMPADYKTARTR